MEYQQSLHILVGDVGQVAERADVPRLLLSHLIDYGSPAGIDVADWERRARQRYSGRVAVAEDLARTEVAR